LPAAQQCGGAFLAKKAPDHDVTHATQAKLQGEIHAELIRVGVLSNSSKLGYRNTRTLHRP
jgi:hypothetical protein